MEWRARLLLARAERLLRRENRRRRRRLAAELSAYRSPADLNDLHALLEAGPAGQTQEIRQILTHQAGVRAWANVPPAE